MDINYQEIAQKAVAYAAQNNIHLDFSAESFENVDDILGCYYEHLAEYQDEDGANTLWNIAVHFGIYLGETLLRLQLGEQGYRWCMEDGIPVIEKDAGNSMSPITKAHKRILNGPEDNVKSFCEIALMIASGKFPTQKVHRAVDVELSSGQKTENVLYREIDSFIQLIAEGKEDFLIMNSTDGFLQFYGVNNQFVAEMQVNLPDSDYHTYSFVNPEKMKKMKRISLETPYGRFTPTEREVLTLAQLKQIVLEYYENITEECFLKNVSYIDTTEETKKLRSGK
ncbi:MAG: hypothetical protein K2N15_01650 [Lachnospiraceae bacterium]|nr:hypothetical protein [Lachnospiraceae bacterium]